MSTFPVATQIPLQAVKSPQSEVPQDFTGFVRRMTGRFLTEDTQVNRAEIRRAALVQHFYRGNQRGYVSPFNLSWQNIQGQNRADPRIVHNWFRPMSRAITGQWTMARTDMVVLPLPSDSTDVHIAGAARYANRLADRLQSLIMTETWRQTRAKYAQFGGMAAFYSYWDPKGAIDVAGSKYMPTAMRPVMGVEQTQTGGGYACLQCGQAGPYEEANETGMCPTCGSDDMMTEEPTTVELPVVAGYNKVPLGFIKCRQVPRYQLKWDRMASSLDEAIYWMWEFPLREEQIQEMYPWWRRSGGTEEDISSARRTEYQLRHQPGNVPQWQAATQQGPMEMPTVRNWWLSPCAYHKYRFDSDFHLAAGLDENTGEIQYDIIPAGTRARDKWPNGAFLTMVGDEVLGIKEEDKAAHWYVQAYDLIPGQIGGDGIEDGVAAQRHINKVKALKDANLENCAGAGALYRSEWIDKADVPSSPFDIAPVKSQTPPDVDLRNQVVAHIERPALSADGMMADQESIQEMQYLLGAGPAITGSPDVGKLNASGTATEAAIQSQGARAQRSPELSLADEANCAIVTQWLKLFQENATDPIALPLEGENGELEWQWFKGADIPANFLVTTRSRSSAPKSYEDLQADLRSAFEMAGGPQGVMMLAQQLPHILEQIEERFGVKLLPDVFGRMSTLVRYRIDLLGQKLGESQIEPGTEAMVAQSLVQDPEIAPDPEEPHQIAIQRLQRWLTSDEALKARSENPTLLIAVHALIQAHRQYGTMQAQASTETQVAADAPARAMEDEKMSRLRDQEDKRQQETNLREDEKQSQARSEKAEDRAHDLQVEQMRARVQEKKMERP